MLSYFDQYEFKNFWFQTGTPTFLLPQLKKHHFVNFENVQAGPSSFESYTLENLELIALLVQTGYLTLKERITTESFRLDYPNREVKASMLEYLIGSYRSVEPALSNPLVHHCRLDFEADDLPAFMEKVDSMFEKVNPQVFRADAEAYFQSLVYMIFDAMRLSADVELRQVKGQTQCAVKTANHIYLVAFTIDQSAESALQPVRDWSLAERFRADERPKTGVGINFGSEAKMVLDWEKIGL